MPRDLEKKRLYDKAYRERHRGEDRMLAYGRAWKKRNPEQVHAAMVKYVEEHRAEKRVYFKAYLARLKRETFIAYGGVSCTCCKETHIEFLTIDHINGGGAEQRRRDGKVGGNLYVWLRRQGYPPGFRVLCMNCNFAMGLFGACPHTKTPISAP